jgi:hypothetical protein
MDNQEHNQEHNQEDIEVEAAVFRRLIAHLQNQSDVQNIDLMILADFCRNCLSKWYEQEAQNRNRSLKDGQARTLVYGMPYAEWKAKYQQPATDEKLALLQQKQTEKLAEKLAEKSAET